MKRIRPYLLLAALASAAHAQSSSPPAPDTAPPPGPGRFQPNYPFSYAPASVDDITNVLERVHAYLDTTTPPKLLDRTTNQEITDYSAANSNAMLARGDFLVVSYEWGVTHAGMFHAAEATADQRYADYAAKRLKFIADAAPMFRSQTPAPPSAPGATTPAPGQGQGPRRGSGAFLFRSVNAPRSLDDSGSMCAAMIKAARAGHHTDALRPFIDNYIKWISSGQFRLGDGTLARNRPLANALWLDDLYMSVPALAQMGALTGETKYFDDAAKQIRQFYQRMFVPGKNLYMHGWIQDMEPHPALHWARANGWAIVAATELLSVLPESHPDHADILAIYRAHARGLAACQGLAGLWHQLLDRTESYPETSASAMFVYSLARGINRGWLDPLAYGPAVSVGWNAVAHQVNEKGQVENTCVGTGMGFEPMFYQFRPVSPLAAHGYGPVLLAGAEMITLRKGKGAQALVSDGAVQFAPSPSRF